MVRKEKLRKAQLKDSRFVLDGEELEILALSCVSTPNPNNPSTFRDKIYRRTPPGAIAYYLGGTFSETPAGAPMGLSSALDFYPIIYLK